MFLHLHKHNMTQCELWVKWINNKSTMTNQSEPFFLDPSFYFTWSCGSIIRGQRRPPVTRIPFSVETVSRGRPSVFHWRMTYGSPRMLIRLKLELMGMFSFWHCIIHWSISWGKGTYTHTHDCIHFFFGLFLLAVWKMIDLGCYFLSLLCFCILHILCFSFLIISLYWFSHCTSVFLQCTNRLSSVPLTYIYSVLEIAS